MAILTPDKTDEFHNYSSARIPTGFGLEIDHCNTLYLNIAKYEPLKGSSYIPLSLPKAMEKRKAIINVKNDDDKCLEWTL